MKISGEDKKRLTDEAWRQLYSRLETDGLIPEQRIRKERSPSSGLRWAAAVAIVCTCIVSIWLIHNQYGNIPPMLTMHNENNSPMLVSGLEDGSIVYLSEGTIQYPEHFKGDKREIILTGGAFFEIARNTKQPFVIDTKAATVKVLGTAFNIYSENQDYFGLSVKEGEVKITLKKSGQSVNVKAGKSVILDADSLLMADIDTDFFFHPLEKIRFKDEPLSNVVRVINMNSPKIQIDIDPKLTNRELTLTFSGIEPQKMVELICLALDLEHRVENNKILIFNRIDN